MYNNIGNNLDLYFVLFNITCIVVINVNIIVIILKYGIISSYIGFPINKSLNDIDLYTNVALLVKLSLKNTVYSFNNLYSITVVKNGSVNPITIIVLINNDFIFSLLKKYL